MIEQSRRMKTGRGKGGMMEDMLELAAASKAPPDLFDLILEDVYNIPPPLPPPQQPLGSAFVPYVGTHDNRGHEVLYHCGGYSSSSSSKNVPKRAIELLRCIHLAADDEKAVTSTTGDGSRCFKHMMRERFRRERQSQCYQDLHSIVSPGSKADKNSIVQSSVVRLRELKATEAMLRRRHQELKERMTTNIEEDCSRSESVKKIEVRVVNPASSIDSIAATLLHLKEMGVGIKSFRSKFSSEGFLAAIEVDTKMETKIVERVVQRMAR